jgi:hypothetical protein
LWLAKPPAAGTAGLLLELDGPARIAASWETNAVADVDPPTQLEWAYGAAGPEPRKRFGAKAVRDGTQGLRRSGVVRIEVPADWAPAGAAVNGLTPYSLWLRTARASFSAPPRLRRIVPNVVAARHAVPVSVGAEALEEQIGRWLPLPVDPAGLVAAARRFGRAEDARPRWRLARLAADLGLLATRPGIGGGDGRPAVQLPALRQWTHRAAAGARQAGRRQCRARLPRGRRRCRKSR